MASANELIVDGHRLSFSIGPGYKKYAVRVVSPSGSARTVTFGDRRFQHYRDRTPLRAWTSLDHGDMERRESYRHRHRGILTKSGKPAHTVPFSPSWMSMRFLW